MIPSSDLITPAYLETQRVLHASPRGYGGKGDKWAPAVRLLVARYGATSVLDYGCGQGSLAAALRADPIPGVRISEYDPAIPAKAHRPSFADLVVCTDVLEHIEPTCLRAVLGHLGELARKAIFLVIATRPSNKTLTDGRNAHLILETETWWETVVREGTGCSRVLPGPPSPLTKPSREWVAVLTP